MMTKYYVDAQGVYLGGFSGETGAVPEGAIEVSAPPADGRDLWINDAWVQNPVVLKEDVDRKIAVFKQVREVAINRLNGIADRLARKGDSTVRSVADAAVEALIDITKNLPADPSLVEVALMTRYLQIRDPLPDSLKTAFAEVDE